MTVRILRKYEVFDEEEGTSVIVSDSSELPNLTTIRMVASSQQAGPFITVTDKQLPYLIAALELQKKSRGL